MNEINSRIKARYKVFELLFSFSFHENGEAYELENLDDFSKNKEINEYIIKTFNGTVKNINKIDEIIGNNIKNRQFSRISKIVLSVLRLGVYELFYEKNIPKGICIYEAVNITKMYSTLEESSYVNAVLSKIAESL